MNPLYRFHLWMKQCEHKIRGLAIVFFFFHGPSKAQDDLKQYLTSDGGGKVANRQMRNGLKQHFIYFLVRNCINFRTARNHEPRDVQTSPGLMATFPSSRPKAMTAYSIIWFVYNYVITIITVSSQNLE